MRPCPHYVPVSAAVREIRGGMTTHENSHYLAPTEVARRLRMSKSSVYRAVERGDLPAIQLARHGALRIPADALEARSQRK